MYSILSGMRIVEAASFVAGPSCALHLAQLGADVIRIDPIGGGPDFNRWPRNGRASLYWEGLQKHKRSIAIDLRAPEGRELTAAIITAPGPDAGLFVTNFPRDGFLAHERLARLRPDLITVRVQGWADGRSGFDYTINAITGYPFCTGPADQTGPVNHVMPAWDFLTGALAATNLLAAERLRRATGVGQEVALPLSGVAIAALGALGQIAEVEVMGEERPRLGNDIYGAFGRDFETRDGRRVMVAAITARQWRNLVEALGLQAEMAGIEAERGVSFATDEGVRYEHRDALVPVVARAIGALDHATLEPLFERHEVCWGPYSTLSETVASHPEFQESNPLIARVEHPSGATYRTPGSPAQYSATPREPARRAPALGEHSAQVLAQVLGLSDARIGELFERGVVADAAHAGGSDGRAR